jgi:hypothetical protein
MKRMATSGATEDPLEKELQESKEAGAAAVRDIASFEQKIAISKTSVAGGFEWSDEAETVHKLPPDLTCEEVMSCFQTLRLPRLKIEEVDLYYFIRLVELDLSGNPFHEGMMQGLPHQLRLLNVYDCQILYIHHLPETLVHLGVGYNALDNVDSIVQMCPNLVSLDLTFNSLTNFSETLNSLSQLQSLKHLHLFGNPLSFAENYRAWVLTKIPTLAVFDDLPINPNKKEEVEDAEKRAAGPQNAVHLVVQIQSIDMVRKPPEEEPPDGQEEYQTVRKYYAEVIAPGMKEKLDTPMMEWGESMPIKHVLEETMEPTLAIRDDLLFSGADFAVYEEVVEYIFPDRPNTAESEKSKGKDKDKKKPKTPEPGVEEEPPTPPDKKTSVKLVGKAHLDLNMFFDSKLTAFGKKCVYDKFGEEEDPKLRFGKVFLDLEKDFIPVAPAADDAGARPASKAGKPKTPAGGKKGVPEVVKPLLPAHIVFRFGMNVDVIKEPEKPPEDEDPKAQKGKKGKKK